jgi:hypothetical protein
MTRRLVFALAICPAVLCFSGSAAQAADAEAAPGEVLDMRPENPASWGLRHLSAPLVSIIRGSGYMYSPREIVVRTVPASSYLDIFYVRSGFQKRFEQAEAPLTVILPSRLAAGSRDSLTIRAFAEGYRQKSVTFKLSADFRAVNIDLAPLPNSLDGLSHRSFAGRATISFLTSEALTFRLQEASDGYGVILTETAISDEARDAVSEIVSPLVLEGYSQQLGEDLMVKLVLRPEAGPVEVRSRQSYNFPRSLHVFTIDLVSKGSDTSGVQAAIKSLALLSGSDIQGCALAFDAALRGELEAGALARALRPSGSFTDRFLRAAMRRLGELSPEGSVEFSDSTRLDVEDPIELEMAMSAAAGAYGYLALLRSFSAEMEADENFQREALRSLVAPELAPRIFAEVLSRSEKKEKDCVQPN